MVRLSELRKQTINLMSKSGIEEARADTDFLLFFLAGVKAEDILLDKKEFSNKEKEEFYKAVKRRISGEPVQYIAGKTEFMSLEFFVDKSTLIPRADTEILTERCIKLTKDEKLKTVLDIGTGSGCIGLSMAYYQKNIDVTLLDISKDALKIAGKNAKALNLLSRVEFANADILNDDFLKEQKFDLIVSNPPYIETKELSDLEKKVIGFEPESALDGGEDGLLFYRRITPLAAKSAKYLAYEIGYNQSEKVEKIMSDYFCDIEILKDYSGNYRVLLGKNKQIK